MPHAEDGIMESSNITESGMEKHLIAYFIAALLCHYNFRRDEIYFVLLSGFILFLYGVVLEVIQFFLPYRTFNIKDVVANASGVIIFIFFWAIYFQIVKRMREGNKIDCR